MIYARLVVNFEVKLTLHDFNTLLFYFDNFSSVVYAILQCKKTDILEPEPKNEKNRSEPNPRSHRTRTEPNPVMVMQIGVNLEQQIADKIYGSTDNLISIFNHRSILNIPLTTVNNIVFQKNINKHRICICSFEKSYC